MRPSMSQERIEYLNKAGNFNEYCEKLSEELGIEYSEVVKKIPSILAGYKTDRGIEIFKLHYMFQMSLMQLRYQTGLQYVRLENHLHKVDAYLKSELAKGV